MNFRQDEFAVRLDVGRFVRDFRATAWIAAAALLLAVLNFGDQDRAARPPGNGTRRAGRGALQRGCARPASHNQRGGALREQVRSAQERADFLGVYRGNLSALDLLTELSALVPPDLDIGLEELSIDRQNGAHAGPGQELPGGRPPGPSARQVRALRQAARIGAIEKDPKTGSKRFNVTISLKGPEAGDRG